MAKTFTRPCAECGTGFETKVLSAEFCSTPCRLAANNRRRDRGAKLLDLYVHQRFNRAEAQGHNVKTLIDRMVSNWMTEDREMGRRAMRPLQDCMQAAVASSSSRHSARIRK